MTILFFIPARKNSKGIKNKNIIKLNKKPLIQYTCDFVKEYIKKYGKNNKIDFLISTDSKEILKSCKINNPYFDYFRPKHLSGDKSNVVDAMKDAIQWLKKKNKNFKTIVLLQPTNPFRNIKELNSIINFYNKNNFKSVASIIEMKEHPNECIEKTNAKWKYLINADNLPYRRQDYKKNYYFIDGSYYILDVDFLNKYNKLIMPKKSKFYEIKRIVPIDIDDKNDLKIAELFLNSKINILS